MKLKVVKNYFDKVKHQTISKGAVLEEPNERGSQLVEAGVAEIVSEPKKAEAKKFNKKDDKVED